jgi:hypothetical protein
MARHASGRTNQIQAEAPTPAGAAVSAGQTASPLAAPMYWGWKISLFVWITSFAFLLLNDLLNAAVKLIGRLF